MSRLDKLQPLFAILEENKNTARSLGLDMMKVDGGTMYPVDLVALAAIKRVLSTSAAFRQLIEALNLISARAILRVHLDTVLRFYAVWLVDNPHDFAKKVIDGEQINHLKDRTGNKMTDSYLAKVLSKDHKWIPTVYANLCGYVHLSSQHLFASVAKLDREGLNVSLQISEYDLNAPEFSWIEVVECFNETTKIFLNYLSGWVYTKTVRGVQGERSEH